ncbi:MAG TPA: decarboxylating 6-phosphogluconate dehydrogenase [bacterium]|nr:decarboxylating 6-phosphogluconate dehydrogenase [bacterium]
MQIGMIGLGRMGGNMTSRLLAGGHNVVAFATSRDSVAAAAREGATAADSLADVVGKLAPPRAVWVMVPAGAPTEDTVQGLIKLLSPGDTILEGGNSNYKDSMRRAAAAGKAGIHYLDVGTSGGIWGRSEGYSLMIGGPSEAVDRLRPIFATLAPAPDKGWGHVGPSGAGHFVKMIHNGIEYGMMQAMAEGFDLMKRKTELHLDLHQVAAIWQHGSVVRSWLLDLTERALAGNPNLDGIAAYVEDSGEGRWTVMESIDLACPAPVITLALQRRFRSRDAAPFADKLLAAMRQQFGGHAVKTES